MKYLMPILVGAAIGYITNWIAIKMLFRPHYEKKIFNIHIPFTPGLIPKERNRIAQSVGEAVGVYLLSPEVVVESLSKGKNDYVKKWVKSYIRKLQQENRSIKDLVFNLGYGEYDKVLDSVKNKIAKIIFFEFGKKGFIQKLIQLIDKYIFINSRDALYQIINEKMELFFHQLAISEETIIGLKDIIIGELKESSTDERPLFQVIPDKYICGIKNMVIEHDEDIAKILKDILNDTEIELKLKGWISNIVSNNLNKLIAIFLSPEIISDKVFESLKESIDQPETNNNIKIVMETLIDKILEIQIGSIVTGISNNMDEDHVLKLSNTIVKYISNEENQKKVMDIISHRLRTEEDNIRDNMSDFMSKGLEKFLESDILYDNIVSTIDNLVEDIINRPISSIIGNIDDCTVSNIANFCNTTFNGFVINKLAHIVQVFNISKVVEDQINSYDVAFAEELILEIAHKELKAITWLGALLGGIMGIILPILQSI